MRALKKIYKIYVIFLFLIFVLLAVALPVCESYPHASTGSRQVLHCPIEQLHKTQSHLTYFEQLSQVLPGHTTLLPLFIAAMWSASLLLIGYIFFSPFFFYFQRQYIFHMKPWDPLRTAFSQGIIQKKHLDFFGEFFYRGIA